MIYHIECGDWKAAYIGKTKRILGIRVKEHMKPKIDAVKKDITSACSEQEVTTRHKMKWTEVSVIRAQIRITSLA